MYFPSKRDWWLGVIFFGVPVLAFFEAIRTDSINGLIVSIIFSVPLLWLWFTTGYRIKGETLYVQYGPFKRKVDISLISKINKTRSPWSAPALSMDRLEILYDHDFKIVLVSPIYQKDFVKVLLEKNSNIRVDQNVWEEE
ncbi:PH domain-containing protein [Piscibacillus halophilus]|uniref:PH domain-containing protein n=1 Tax=Piscibacillus halophilus TaxID=571933 RepID=UPI002409B9A6|nr:PH domain-containing protein [Piscibacillus halophilus]